MSAEILLTCPWCKTPNFGERGLRAHVCRSAPGGTRRRLSAPALHLARKAAGLVRVPAVVSSALSLSPTNSPDRMSKFNTAGALALINETKVVDEQLHKLQAETLTHYKRMTEIAQQREVMRHEESLRGIVLGVNLLRIQASLAYGQWGKWRAKHMPHMSARWVDYLMSLALVFIAKAKVSKPVDLALPGEQTALVLDGPASDLAVLVKKAQKFVGKKSLSELLADHGIKKAALGGKRTKSAGADEDEGEETDATPEQLAARARTDLADFITTGRQLLLTDNVCQHLTPADVKAFDASFKALGAEWRASLKKTLGEDAAA